MTEAEQGNHTTLEMKAILEPEDEEDQDEDEVDEELEDNISWYQRPINHPTVQRVYNMVCPFLTCLYLNAEWAGEKIADVLGITQSRFQYAIDEHNRLVARKARKEAYILKRLEEEWLKEQQEKEEAALNNTATVEFDNNNQADGLELHRLEDPEDGLIDIPLDSPSKKHPSHEQL
eukprot:TRINITY_DN9447_c0_g1_i2.p1 TRINITY_DN9447_c0_g1~~TRINITY_DN9447_c0_g1_i2.p1  ORF type:complete len:202 (+),score=44.98 TRINITY_DN9447_c0_g1_i2:80-607(+)